MVRTRQCNNPPPSGGGAPCTGRTFELKDCKDSIIIDNSCKTHHDCYKPDKKCYRRNVIGCICKLGQCVYPLYCGLMNLIFFLPCYSCPRKYCEDAGACRWRGRQCEPILVNGKWSEWGSWGSCRDEKQVRRRLCNNPAPSGGGTSCPGSPVEARQCPPNPSGCRCNGDVDVFGRGGHCTDSIGWCYVDEGACND